MNPVVFDILSEHSGIWLGAITVPFVLALAVLPPRVRPAALLLAPWGGLPALAFALWATPDSAVDVPWLLLGMRLGMDATARVFLLFTAVLWTCAGVYARAYLHKDVARHRFFAFYLITLSGNVGAILAQDIASFYLFFALMSFAAYPLVVYDGTPEAGRAGRVYLALVVIGEVLLVSALLLTAAAVGSMELRAVPAGVAAAVERDFIVGLTLVGFGIKVGALPLHVWLPLAHPVAPTPASAVLSGTMIKVGLLGWLRFLPLGEVALPTWGGLCLAAGLLAVFYGVAVGLTQDHPKTILAYSSISQMGFMTLAVGMGLMAPEAWPMTLSAVLLYALHHALAKGTLFLGVGVAEGAGSDRWSRRLVLLGLLLPALALAGAPLTSGAAAKSALKSATVTLPTPWPGWLATLLPLAAVGTTLLMGRFLMVIWPSSKTEGAHLRRGLWLPWAALTLAVAAVPWLVAPAGSPVLYTASFAALWPVLLGALLSAMAWRRGKRAAFGDGLQIPPGDLLSLAAGATVWVRQGWRIDGAIARGRWLPFPLFGGEHEGLGRNILSPLRMRLMQIERWLGGWTAAGVVFLLLTVALFLFLAVI